MTISAPDISLVVERAGVALDVVLELHVALWEAVFKKKVQISVLFLALYVLFKAYMHLGNLLIVLLFFIKQLIEVGTILQFVEVDVDLFFD